MPGTSNYQDYRDFPQQGTRHVSDSNVSKYSNLYKPNLRGQSTSSELGYQHPNNQYNPGHQPLVSARGPTPSFDRPPQPRGPTPSYEVEQRNLNYRNNNSNYQVFPRGGTPTNLNSGSHWNYADDPEMRRGNVNVSGSNIIQNREHMIPKHEVLPPSGGNYGNQPGGNYGNQPSGNYGYRDPVYSAMAGKRPVKSLQQPNSAKV